MYKELYFASKLGDIEKIEQLIEKGADINFRYKKTKGGSPLFIATANNQINTVKFLLEKGADLYSVDKFGRTALHISALLNRVEIAELLISRGLEVDSDVGNLVKTPLHMAAKSGSFKTLELLISKDADVDKRDFMGHTPLRLATDYGHLRVAKELLHLSTVIFEEDVAYFNFHAMYRKGHFSVIKEILEYYFARGYSSDRVCNKRFVAFIVKKGNLEILKIILDCGYDMDNCLSTYGMIILHYSINNNKVDIVRELCSRGARLDIEMSRMGSTLHIACKKGYLEIAKILLYHGADYEKKTATSKRTPLDFLNPIDRLEIEEYISSLPCNIKPAKR